MRLSLKRENIKVLRWEDLGCLPKSQVSLGVVAQTAGLTLVLMQAEPAMASTKDAMIKAFWPVIDLVQGIAYPIAFLMITGGMLLIMIGNRNQGMRMMKMAVVGYIGCQFAPSLMRILADVGSAMGQ